MPVDIQCPNLTLSSEKVASLWRATISYTDKQDDLINLRCVSEAEIETLNATYRKKQKPTNVLTFSYGEGEHDVALCLSVVEREAVERELNLQDYTALVLVHAFLHVCGMDHERSDEEEKATHAAEESILKTVGFSSLHL